MRVHRNGRRAKWLHLQAEPVHELRDAAGSGDWLTAGLIHSLWSDGFARTTFEMIDVETALSVGQNLLRGIVDLSVLAAACTQGTETQC